MEFPTLIVFGVVALITVLSLFNPFDNAQKSFVRISKKRRQ